MNFRRKSTFTEYLSGLLLVPVAVLLVGPAVYAQTDSISLDLNDDAVRLSWAHDQTQRKIRFGASYLNHQDRGDVLSGDFHITGNAASEQRPVHAGLGGRLVWAGAEIDDPPVFTQSGLDEDGFALAVGGFFESKLPQYDRIGFGGHLYFAPDVLAFGDMEQYTDIWLYGTYSVLRQGEVYLGVRNVKGDFKLVGDHTFDTGLHVGFKLKF